MIEIDLQNLTEHKGRKYIYIYKCKHKYEYVVAHLNWNCWNWKGWTTAMSDTLQFHTWLYMAQMLCQVELRDQLATRQDLRSALSWGSKDIMSDGDTRDLGTVVGIISYYKANYVICFFLLRGWLLLVAWTAYFSVLVLWQQKMAKLMMAIRSLAVQPCHWGLARQSTLTMLLQLSWPGGFPLWPQPPTLASLSMDKVQTSPDIVAALATFSSQRLPRCHHSGRSAVAPCPACLTRSGGTSNLLKPMRSAVPPYVPKLPRWGGVPFSTHSR